MTRRRYGTDPVPADLAFCNRCRKVAGRYKGFYGAECQCDQPQGPADVGHSIGTRPGRGND